MIRSTRFSPKQGIIKSYVIPTTFKYSQYNLKTQKDSLITYICQNLGHDQNDKSYSSSQNGKTLQVKFLKSQCNFPFLQLY